MECTAECTAVYTMMDLTVSAGERTTIIVVGFTFIVEAPTVLVIMPRQRSEDIMTSATANITNSIIANILTNGTNIGGIPNNPQDMKRGGNETSNQEEWRFTCRPNSMIPTSIWYIDTIRKF